MRPTPRLSLRLKLLLAAVAIELVMLALLISNAVTLLQSELRRQGELRMAQFIAVADASLSAPLAQRDYATLQQTLDQFRSGDSIKYLVLLDHRDQVVSASGWQRDRALPPPDAGFASIDLERADHCVHGTRRLEFAGQQLGTLRFGFSTDFLLAARREMLKENLPIAATVVVATAALLAAVGLLLTRQLTRLDSASRRISTGDYDVSVPIVTQDDIGHLSQSFNAMAAAIKQRVQALEHSERLQREHLEQARAEHERLVSLLEAMDSGIVFLDADDQVLYSNGAFARIWRLDADELAALRPVGAVAARLMPELAPGDMRADLFRDALSPDGADVVELRTRDDRIIVQRQRRIFGDGGRVAGRLVIHDDATNERRNLLRAQLADRDALTDLLNRRGLHDALVASVAEADRTASSAALFFVDLDDFKYANDTFGHRTGDELLRAVAVALSAELRRGELVARIGGDEFAVLCPNTDVEAATAIAPRLVQAVARLRHDAGGHELRVGCSVGLAVYPDHAFNADDLIVCADTAMYQAKHAGKNGWALYQQDTRRLDAQSAHMRWNVRITRAIDEGRFRLEFQPIHRAADRSVSHHEALLRMPMDEQPALLIPPGEFVPYAERSGKIRQIDRWVLQACIDLLARRDESVSLAANLSARSIDDPTLPEFIERQLASRAIDPRRLCIELTEAATIADTRTAGAMIKALRKLGCRVHLDDFGSGFASFAHLKLLDVDAIKIDGTYIRGLAHNEESRVFVAAMIAVARGLNMATIAEHVEDEQTLQILRTMGVDMAQGHFFGRPGALPGETTHEATVVSITQWRHSDHSRLSGGSG
jgi:diguanylate cyclase (GGDEF)-like protein